MPDQFAVTPPPPRYVGRFAPSPTGPLHFGSLLSALASYLDARAHHGRWLLRIEDIDPPREQPGAAAAIISSLCAHGLHQDGDILFQSTRHDAYRAAVDRLLAAGQAFYCTCSRSQLARHAVYPGHCRSRHRPPAAPTAIRLQVPEGIDIAFADAVQGDHCENLARSVGDFVIYRKEGLPAYQLAVVVDDAAQGVTHVVRGSDLLDNTARQIWLQQCLRLPPLRYAHIPVIANTSGQKLSKQTYARALVDTDAADNLRAALDFLGQPAPPPAAQTPAAVLDFAVAHWQLAAIPHAMQLSGAALPPRCRQFTA